MESAFASDSQKGTKHHVNEDRLLCWPEGGLFAVADGMSGAVGGAVASEMATQALKEYLLLSYEENVSLSRAQLLREAILGANFALFQASLRKPEYIGMGTTLTAALVLPKSVIIGHVGDSRCYRLSGGAVDLLTKDHVTNKKDEKKILSQCIGYQENVAVDILEFPLDGDSTYLLCTDGISDFVDENDLRKALLSSSYNEAIQNLVRLARLRGTTDDTSVIVFRPSDLVEEFRFSLQTGPS